MRMNSSLTSAGANGTIILIRHGKAANEFYKDKPDEYPGPPLSEEGVRQAQTLNKVLSRFPIEKCYFSPFARTRQTAQIAFNKLCSPQESSYWQEKGESESELALRNRIESWIYKYSPKNGEILAVVTHASPIKAAMEIWAAQLVRNAVVYDRGNIVPVAGIFLAFWKKGRVVASQLLTSDSVDALSLEISEFESKTM